MKALKRINYFLFWYEKAVLPVEIESLVYFSAML